MADDDAWMVPTTTMQDASLQPNNEQDTDLFDYDVDHTRTVQGDVNRERWIKVFGFSSLDVVLQEFEKVGKIERYRPAAGRCVFYVNLSFCFGNPNRRRKLSPWSTLISELVSNVFCLLLALLFPLTMEPNDSVRPVVIGS